MTSTRASRTTKCAGVGVGYWECDVVGGCADCRRIARVAEDSEQLAEWYREMADR